jgi:hypothetical protein
MKLSAFFYNRKKYVIVEVRVPIIEAL